MLRVNLQNSNWGCALLLASRNGHTEAVKLLLDHGAQVNFQDRSGVSALMLACLEGHTETVKILLDHGALVNRRNKDGKCALDYSKEKYTNPEIIKKGTNKW